MTTTLDPRSTTGVPEPLVNYDEPPRRSPPMLAVGPLAWVRNNLFSSLLDTIITIVTAVIVVSILVSFLVWAIGQAEWFVIIYNLRLLLLGRYPAAQNWRVLVLTLITAFSIGVTLAAYTRVSRKVVAGVAVGLALLFVIPPVIWATVPATPSYLAAGNVEIASGSAKETPQPMVGFIARAGETFSVGFADQFAANDQALEDVRGFSDKATSLVANAAATRLTTAARVNDLNAQLSSDLLTAGQRSRLEIQLGKLTVPPPISETYPINQSAINVRILRGTTMEPVAEGTLSADSAPISVTLPEDGWYVLEKTPVDEDNPGVALLEVYGIGPLLERQLTRSGEEDAEGNIPAAQRISQYVRLTDGFTTEELRPQFDGSNVPMSTTIDQGYRLDHTFGDYLRLYVTQFFDLIKLPLTLIVIVGAVGYVAARFADRTFSPAEKPHKTSRRASTWLIIASPVIMFGLVYGVGNILPLTDTRLWGGLLLTIMLTLVSSVASFPIGVALALGRRSKLPIISGASTIYIEFVRGVPMITVLFMAQLLVPLVNPALAEMPNVFRAMIAITLFNAAYLAENIRGGLQSIPPGQEEAAKALGLNGLQITLYITLPQALRAILPALVGMVISLFKDTSLVAIVGLLDLTGMAQAIVTQTEFLGLRRETLLFITIIYFVVSYVIAAVSRRIEVSGAGKARMRLI